MRFTTLLTTACATCAATAAGSSSSAGSGSFAGRRFTPRTPQASQPLTRVNFTDGGKFRDGWPERADGKTEVHQWDVTPMRGVNLGGWLVLEVSTINAGQLVKLLDPLRANGIGAVFLSDLLFAPAKNLPQPWITPSLFENKPDWVVDESTYGQYVRSHNHNMSELWNHWDTWIVQSDFKEIKDIGLNTVRIPIGFWSLVPLEVGETFVVGAFEHLKSGVRWAKEEGLNVMLDLHGAPGGQNGWDNSGQVKAHGFFDNSTTATRALAALQVLMTEFTKPEYANVVTSIELVNEPFPWGDAQIDFLKEFYREGYKLIRGQSEATPSGGGITVVLSDAYLGPTKWEGFMVPPTFQRVALDYHAYSVFDPKMVSSSLQQTLHWYCQLQDGIKRSDDFLWTIVGEFTVASTDCAKWLNGRGKGARWDNSLEGAPRQPFPGDCKTRTGDSLAWTKEYKEWLYLSFETQSYVYEKANGWVFWTWRTEGANDWSMKAGIHGGWIPNPVYKKSHGTPCDFSKSAYGMSGAPSSALRTAPQIIVTAFALAAAYLTI